MTLLERIQEVKTIGDGFPVYEKAQVTVQEFDPNDVSPTSKYLLRHKLRRINRLRQEVDWTGLEHRENINGRVIAPPVVENDGEADCIVDGLHRFAIARIKGLKVKAIYVSGSSEERPIIGKPVEWESVKIRREKPETATNCRDLRVEDDSETLRNHYRDFSFMGSSGRRPRLGQDG